MVGNGFLEGVNRFRVMAAQGDSAGHAEAMHKRRCREEIQVPTQPLVETHISSVGINPDRVDTVKNSGGMNLNSEVKFEALYGSHDVEVAGLSSNVPVTQSHASEIGVAHPENARQSVAFKGKGRRGSTVGA